MKNQKINFLFVSFLLFASLCLISFSSFAKDEKLFKPFLNKDIDFFPVPVFETSPEEGESYGLLPVVLFSDKETKSIQTILAALLQYNSIIKFSGAGIFHYFPQPKDNPDEVFELYVEFAQRFYRETTLHYFNPHFFEKLYLDADFVWLQTPFRRFYGYGANSVESGESNYVSRNFYSNLTLGYYFLPTLRLNFREQFTTTDLRSRAITDVSDTLTRYGTLPGIFDATHFIHYFSLTFDSRPEGQNSSNGFFVEGNYFFSHKSLGSDTTFQGYSFEAISLIPLFQKKTITALRFFFQDMYGSGIPFYLQSHLGGENELRSFIRYRFRDTGKIIFTWEQRIAVLNKELFGVPFTISVDPFFEVGRVFNHINNLGFQDIQPVGGIGIRGIVKPNVVARVDVSVGTEGYNIYTMLNYPF